MLVDNTGIQRGTLQCFKFQLVLLQVFGLNRVLQSMLSLS